MKAEPFFVDSEYVEFDTRSNIQTIKITNPISEPLGKCHFCIYNKDKFEFRPESFELLPREEKVIEVRLLNNQTLQKSKEFAYIKCKDYSKKIILTFNDQGESDYQMRSPSEMSMQEELKTLESRDYRDTQKYAFDRVVAEKEAYIKRLERRLEEEEESHKKDRSFTSEGKNRKNHISQIEELEEKVILISKEKEVIENENKILKENIVNLQMLFNTTNKSNELAEVYEVLAHKEEAITHLKFDLHSLEVECENLLLKMAQKEESYRKLEEKSNKRVDELIRTNDRRLLELQIKMENEREKSERENKSYRSQIKLLESRVCDSQGSYIKNDEGEVVRLENELLNEKQKRKEYEEDKRNLMKCQIQNEKLNDENSLLRSKVDILERSIDDLKEQTIIYKSKISDWPSDKASRYLEVALESCRNENEILKRSKKEVEFALSETSKDRNSLEQKLRYNELTINELKSEIQELKALKVHFENQNRQIKDEHHEAIIKLKSENIDLIEKISFGKVSRTREEEFEREIQESKIKLEQSQLMIKKHQESEESLMKNLRDAESHHSIMSKKMEKYRKEAKKELKNITESTLDELKKAKDENKRLHKKISEFEQSISEKEKLETRTKINSLYIPNKNEISTNYPISHIDRRTGIKNQKREISESSSVSRQDFDLDQVYGELGQLREFKNYMRNQVKKMKSLPGIHELFDNEEVYDSIFSFAHFFDQLYNVVENKYDETGRLHEAEKEVNFLKGRLEELENNAKYVKNNESNEERLFSAIEVNKFEGENKKLLEYVRLEMKGQFKKLNDSLQICQEKFKLLKKKIYEEYRSRIINILNSKSKNENSNSNQIQKLETILEKFVESLGNKSHKEAHLAKEIKLKQEAKKEIGTLKEKINYLTNLLETKKGYCTREPLKVFDCENEPEWHDNIKLEAKMLTFEAENARLNEEVDLLRLQVNNSEEGLKNSFNEIEEKEDEIIRLKKEVIEIKNMNAKELIKRQEQIDELSRKFFAKENIPSTQPKQIKDKELQELKDDIDRKKTIIKNLKEKERMLEQIIEDSSRSEETIRSKMRKEQNEDFRVQESLRDFKENNRELRLENGKLREEIECLREELSKKNSQNKRIKVESEEYRIKALREDHEELEKLRAEIKSIKEELKSSKSDYEKLKKRKEKEVSELESELKKLKNEHLIDKSSLESIIRALSDCIGRIYSDLEIICKKKRVQLTRSANFQELLDHPGEIDSLKVYETFEEILTAIRN